MINMYISSGTNSGEREELDWLQEAAFKGWV
jgi:hypothetical protein